MNPFEPVKSQEPIRSSYEGATGPRLLEKSGVYILVVAIVFAAIAAVSLIGFAYNLSTRYPGTNILVIQHDPMWMASHLVRGLGLGYLVFLLWKYQQVVQSIEFHGTDEEKRFCAIHNRIWVFGASFFVLNLSFSMFFLFCRK